MEGPDQEQWHCIECGEDNQAWDHLCETCASPCPLTMPHRSNSLEKTPPKRRRLFARSTEIKRRLRQQRRDRNGAMRDGFALPAPPVVDYDECIGASLGNVCVGGLQLKMPVQPLRSQLQLMQSAVRALHEGKHALLESPTGTGKTLALLCSVLAYQRQCVEQGRVPPRCVWVARTHLQLQHAVNELRRLPYRPMVSWRLSRERFCLHPRVKTSKSKAEACELATMVGRGEGCSFLDHAESIGYPQLPEHLATYHGSGRLAVPDIEDMIQEGVAKHVCPFHTAQDLAQEGAGLVLLTYQQLLDPTVRVASMLEPVLEGSIIVVDEAHNLPAACIDAASFESSDAEMSTLCTQLQLLSTQCISPDARRLAESVLYSLKQLQEWTIRAARGDTHPIVLQKGAAGGVQTTDAEQINILLQHIGLKSYNCVDKAVSELRRLRRALIEAGLESTAVRSASVNQMEEFLSKMRFVLSATASYCLSVATDGGILKLRLICHSGRVAFKPAIRECRTALLASGTLQPFDLIARELGLQLSPTAAAGEAMQADCTAVASSHHAHIAQMVLPVVLKSTTNTARMSSCSRNRESVGYLDAIGTAVQALFAVLPSGVLVFFASYKHLDLAVQRWQTSGLWARLAAQKQLFREERFRTGDEMDALLSEYRQVSEDAGAALFAVMRGRVSEGADFRDHQARGVIVIGVPFSTFDAQLQLKMTHDDTLFGRGSGREWYEAGAYRLINQALGRLIRHPADHGVLVLLDERFAQPSKHLSSWVTNLLRSLSLQDTVDAVTHFIEERNGKASKQLDI